MSRHSTMKIVTLAWFIIVTWYLYPLSTNNIEGLRVLANAPLPSLHYMCWQACVIDITPASVDFIAVCKWSFSARFKMWATRKQASWSHVGAEARSRRVPVRGGRKKFGSGRNCNVSKTCSSIISVRSSHAPACTLWMGEKTAYAENRTEFYYVRVLRLDHFKV